MITPEINDFLDLHKLGYVATVSSDSKPNISPKGTIIGWTSKLLAFADIRSPDTVINLQNNQYLIFIQYSLFYLANFPRLKSELLFLYL